MQKRMKYVSVSVSPLTERIVERLAKQWGVPVSEAWRDIARLGAGILYEAEQDTPRFPKGVEGN